MDFPTEKEAEAYLENMLKPHFTLHRQVGMRHLDGHKLRSDYLAVPSLFTDFPAEVIGIEVKKGYLDGFKDFSAALKQCIDYRHSVIEDPRAKKFPGQPLKWVFLFPAFQDHYERDVERGVEAGVEPDQLLIAAWRNGCQFAGERFAGKFNVGFVREAKVWASPTPEMIARGEYGGRVDALEFRVSAARIWDSVRGASKQGENWRSDRGRGSA